MKVETDTQDKYGRWPIWFTGAKLSEIHEYLYQNYQGYKFCIVFDETKDEYETYEKRVPVYFLDEIDAELKAYKEGI